MSCLNALARRYWPGPLVILLLLVPALAASSEIPLPDLAGIYAAGENRVAVVDLGGPIPEPELAEVRLVGSITPGIAEGSDGYDGTTQFPWHAEFIFGFYESDPGFWMAYTPPETDGVFSLTVSFQDLFGANWDFFLDGEGELTVEFAPNAFVGDTHGILPPTGRIDEATLILSGVIQNDATSWGQVKALYD